MVFRNLATDRNGRRLERGCTSCLGVCVLLLGSHVVGSDEAVTQMERDVVVTWNHRLMRRIDEVSGEEIYQIHEVFYEEGEVKGWTENGIAPLGETKKKLKKELKRMLDSLDKPVLDYATGKPVKTEKENDRL